MPANKNAGYSGQGKSAPTPEGGAPVFWLVTTLLWVAWCLWLAFRPGAETLESIYSRGLYRFIVAVVTPLTETVSFSIALCIVVFLLGVFPLMWVLRWYWLRSRKRGSHANGFFWGVKWLLFLVPFVVLWFLLFWGIGYQRVPAEKRMDFNTAAITDTEAADLRAMCLAIILRDQPKTPEERNTDRAISAISVAMEEVIAQWDTKPISLPRRVKATPKGLLMVNGSSGICAPITLEPHVDGGLPDTAFVFVAAHELGHVAGMCVEAEATLAGFVSGLRAADAYARYAVALDVYRDLYASLPPDQMKAASEALPEVAREDIVKYREAHNAYKIDWVQSANRTVYNQYLKSQNIAEGMKNYDKGITLFTYAWRKGLVTTAGEPAITIPVSAVQTPGPADSIPVESPPAVSPTETSLAPVSPTDEATTSPAQNDAADTELQPANPPSDTSEALAPISPAEKVKAP